MVGCSIQHSFSKIFSKPLKKVVGSAREGRGRVGDFYTRDRSTPLPDQFYVSNTLFLYLFLTVFLVAVSIFIVVPMVVAVVLFVSGEQVGHSFKVASMFTLHAVVTILQNKSIREEKMTLKAHLLGRKTASQHSGNHLVSSQKPFLVLYISFAYYQLSSG